MELELIFASARTATVLINDGGLYHTLKPYRLRLNGECFGETEKTEYWVKRLCEEAFSYEDDGFPGDEDNGTTAVWYIFTNMGLYLSLIHI